MNRGSLEYEDALASMVEILRQRARAGLGPITYGDLSDELARRGHVVPAHEGPMPLLLEDATEQGSPDGSLPMLSAMVVLKDTRSPSAGFYKLARKAPYRRSGDDLTLWIAEMTALERHYAAG